MTVVAKPTGVRLFVAVWPSAEVAELLQALPRPDVPGLRWSSPDQWHVTLRFLGTVADELVPDVAAAIGTIDVDEVVANVGPTTGRFGDRILHVPVDGLDPLAAVARAVVDPIIPPTDVRPFSGHLTLGRVNGRDRVRLEPLTGVPLSATFVADEITLVRSQLGKGGSTYQVVASHLL